ncbi:MAG: glutathione S-transferase [Pseudomonadota bacterium]
MGDTLPLLYSFRRCPYAMRARMALLLNGKTVRLRELILRDKPEEMLEASPKGTVPVLVLPDGTVIDESLAVMEWAITTGEGALEAPTEDERSLIDRNDGPFKHDLDRYKYPNRYDDVDPLAHRSSGAEFLSTLNERLRSAGHLSAHTDGFADIGIFPFVRQFRIADQAWFDAQDWPALHAWLDRHMTRDLFTKAMAKFPLWKETGEEVLFGDP